MDDIFDEEVDDRLQPAEGPEYQIENWEDEPGGLPGVEGAGADDEELYDPAAELEVQPQPEPVERQTTSDRRQALLQLAKKTAATEGDGSKKRKSKKDKRDKQQEQRSGRPKRLRQAAEPDAGAKRVRPSGPELPEDAYEETAEDKDFIDDAGVPEEERYEGDDLEVLARAEEAEEAAFGDEEDGEPLNIVDEVIKSRKRRKKASDEQVDADVYNLIAQMKACADKDLKVVEAGEKKPAMSKFKHLQHVNELLRQKSHHEAFIQQDGLTAMANWLRPYPNGALPLLQIRNTLVDLLALMNLDTSNDYTREKLEHSELGKIIMFYEKNPHDKTMSLKTKCRDLVLAWSAPIFADADAETRKRRAREREHRLRMAAEKDLRNEQEKRESEAAEKRRKAREGEDGFRTRAAVPQPGRLDFVINPGSRVDPLDGPRAGVQPGAKPGGKPKSPMPEALAKTLAAKKRGTRDRFGGMSVEGRGLIV